MLLRCRRSSADSFVKTQFFYFRWRCTGADLQGLHSLALPHPQANQLGRRQPTARKSTTTSIGALAITSGFVYPVTPRRSIEVETPSSAPQGGKGFRENWFSRKARRVSGLAFPQKCPRLGFLGGKRYERERALCVRRRIRVFSLSVLLVPFRTSEKELARRRNLTFLFLRKEKSGVRGFAPAYIEHLFCSLRRLPPSRAAVNRFREFFLHNLPARARVIGHFSSGAPGKSCTQFPRCPMFTKGSQSRG